MFYEMDIIYTDSTTDIFKLFLKRIIYNYKVFIKWISRMGSK